MWQGMCCGTGFSPSSLKSAREPKGQIPSAVQVFPSPGALDLGAGGRVWGKKRESGAACEPGGPGVGLEQAPSGEGQWLTQSGMGQDIMSEATGHGTVRQCRLEEFPRSTHGGRAHHPLDSAE